MRRLLFIPLLWVSMSSALAAGEFYCCHDPSTGRRICADVMPVLCRGQAYRVFDSGGNVIKEVGAPLTAEEKAELAIENRRRKELEDASRVQRRRDQALLDTYAMPEDIDLAQRKAEADVNLAILATITRIDQARTKRKKFEDEAEFYKKKTMPPELERDLRALDHEIRLQQELLDIKRHEFEVIKAKYDADRKRYYELTRRPLPPPSGATRPVR